MYELFLPVIYLLAPTYFSNMASVVSARLFKWNTPIISDKYTFRGKPILGKNKTWRGVIFGTLVGFLVYLFQKYLYSQGILTSISIHNYESLLLGLLLAFGAVFGDMIESFVKRQLNIKPGARFIPWDQIDHALTAMILALFILDISLYFILSGIVYTFILHVLGNFLGYKIKLRKTLW